MVGLQSFRAAQGNEWSAAPGLPDIAAHGVNVPIEKPVALVAAARELVAKAEASSGDRIQHALRLLGLLPGSTLSRYFRAVPRSFASAPSSAARARRKASRSKANIKSTLFALISDQRAPKSERVTQELLDELRRSGLFDFSVRAALRARARPALAVRLNSRRRGSRPLRLASRKRLQG
jgi:hypothetical protein